MVFNEIMQVGKTPQITQDIALNPFNIYMDDVTPLIFAQLSLGTGQNLTSGTVLNLSNPNYDYTAAPAFVVLSTGLSGSSTGTLSIDIGKQLDLRGLTVYFNLGGDNSHSGTVTIDISDNGTTWNTLSTDLEPAGSPASVNYTRTFSAIRLRYIRISFLLSSGVGDGKNFSLYALKLQIDSAQRFYS